MNSQEMLTNQIMKWISTAKVEKKEIGKKFERLRGNYPPL
jgi:hypothetical protein